MRGNVLILEDNKLQMGKLRDLLEGLPYELKVFCASDLKSAGQLLVEHTFQLFLLDIILDTDSRGDVSGIRLAEMLRADSRYIHTPIIFVTSVEDPKLYSYSRLHCFGYIEKPYDPVTVKQTVLDALKVPVSSREDRYVSFQKDRILYSKQIKEIIYLEISRKEITVVCVNDVLKIPYKPCKEILEHLDSDVFFQCSRSVIVNRNYVDCVDYATRYIKLKNCNTRLELGKVIGKEFEEKMNRWLQRI